MDAQISGSGQSDPDLIRYSVETIQPEDSVMAYARSNAESRGISAAEISAIEARHLEILVRMSGARRAVEIGTRAGYAGIAIARGLGAGGRLHTFELDPHHAEVARHAIGQAALLAEVVIHVGPALENLPDINKEAPFDFIYIDADKIAYPEYLTWATAHLRVGGAIVADSTFASGKIHRSFDLAPEEEKVVKALREFNQIVASSGRFRSTILPTFSGMTVAIKIN
jgi:caffeoyl-CoA O-methyltransferase